MASLRGPLALFALAVTTAACAALIGIEDTTDEQATGPQLPDSGGRNDVDAEQPVDDDAAIPEEPAPDEDAGTYADVVDIDAPVTTCAETGLVARWKLDEKTGTVATDCSGNKLHGVITKGTWESNGADGGAVRFDGNGWVGFANPSLLRITGALTITLWLRYDQTTTTTAYVFGKTSNPATNGYRLGIIDTASQLAFATPSSASNFNVVGGNVPLSKWQHVASVFDPGNKTEVYLNGTRANVHSNAPSAMVASSAEARIGARFDGLYGMHGAVYDVRVYSRALSATEISALSKQR